MIPPFQQYLYPFLKLMGDGKVRNISQVSEDLGKEMNLTEEELSETYETSGHNRHLAHIHHGGRLRRRREL